MIEAILFDFGQTLVDSANGFRAAEKEAQALLLEDLKKSTQQDIPHEGFLSEYRNLRKQFQESSNYSRKSLWQAACSHFDCQADPCLLERREEEYWQRVKRMTRVFPETVEVLRALQSRYKIGLITNTQGQPHSADHRLGEFPELEQFFESIVIAGEAGIPAKPDPLPFKKCLTELNVEASAAVYVGDDWRNDVCGARDAGLAPVWIKHRSVERNWPQIESDVPTIDNLKHLLNIEENLL